MVMPQAPRINALQRYWLREIGIEKNWLKMAEPVAMPAQASAAVAMPADEDSRSALRSAGASQATQQAPRSPSGAASAAGRPVAVTPGGSAAQPVSGAAPVARRTEARAPDTGSRAPVVQTDAAIALMDFDTLRQHVVQCEACGLCQGRRHAVFGMGARPARWMIVGEAPGEQEDRQGLPFVGRSGKLLDAMLSSVGMSREKDVFIANVIKCRPPGNRNPRPEEVAACSPYLRRQIELIQPEGILVLGRFAAQTLLGTDATIGALRGRRHVWNTESGRTIPVVVSYHPAYLLRSPVEKARAWQDLQLAVSLG